MGGDRAAHVGPAPERPPDRFIRGVAPGSHQIEQPRGFLLFGRVVVSHVDTPFDSATSRAILSVIGANLFAPAACFSRMRKAHVAPLGAECNMGCVRLSSAA